MRNVERNTAKLSRQPFYYTLLYSHIIIPVYIIIPLLKTHRILSKPHLHRQCWSQGCSTPRPHAVLFLSNPHLILSLRPKPDMHKAQPIGQPIGLQLVGVAIQLSRYCFRVVGVSLCTHICYLNVIGWEHNAWRVTLAHDTGVAIVHSPSPFT